MEQDPLGQAAGDTNVYRADGDNPIVNIDPTGLFSYDDLVSSPFVQAWANDVRSWDAVLGDLHTSWFAEGTNTSAGIADGIPAA